MVRKLMVLGLALVSVGCLPVQEIREEDLQTVVPITATPTAAVIQPIVQLEDFGPAPELQNEIWLNVDGPLRLQNLRGKVVLLEMWTFG